MISKLKKQMLDRKVLKQIKSVKKDMINNGQNPVEGFTLILNDSVKDWIDDSPNRSDPLNFLIAGLEGTMDMCEKMQVDPGKLDNFPRLVNRIKRMAEAKGYEVEIKTNIAGIQS